MKAFVFNPLTQGNGAVEMHRKPVAACRMVQYLAYRIQRVKRLCGIMRQQATAPQRTDSRG